MTEPSTSELDDAEPRGPRDGLEPGEADPGPEPDSSAAATTVAAPTVAEQPTAAPETEQDDKPVDEVVPEPGPVDEVVPEPGPVDEVDSGDGPAGVVSDDIVSEDGATDGSAGLTASADEPVDVHAPEQPATPLEPGESPAPTPETGAPLEPEPPLDSGTPLEPDAPSASAATAPPQQGTVPEGERLPETSADGGPPVGSPPDVTPEIPETAATATEADVAEAGVAEAAATEAAATEAAATEAAAAERRAHARHRAETGLTPRVPSAPRDRPGRATAHDRPGTPSTAEQAAKPTAATAQTTAATAAQPARRTPARKTSLATVMSPRGTRGQILAAVLCAVLGFAMVAQARQTNVDGLASLRQSDLVEILSGLNEQSARLESEIRDLQATRDQLGSGSSSDAAAQEAAEERLEVLGILTGTAPASGPGVELSISDPELGVSADELLNAVQELRGAGAEALQIGDVRVVAQTAFVDGAEGVVVDGQVLMPPYRITAIGDPQALSTALNIPGGVLEALRNEEATGTVRRLDEVRIDALRALEDAEYARPAPTKD